MGQRLGLEIVLNGNILANAYYHWSGYTVPAAKLAEQVISYIRNHQDKENNKLLLTVKALNYTGAGFDTSELERIKKEKFREIYDFATDMLAYNRNCGLIAITAAGIRETHTWIDCNVVIDIGTEIVCFDEYFYFGDEERQEYIKDYGMTPEEYVKKHPETVVDISPFWNGEFLNLNMENFEAFARYICPYNSEPEYWMANGVIVATVVF